MVFINTVITKSADNRIMIAPVAKIFTQLIKALLFKTAAYQDRVPANIFPSLLHIKIICFTGIERISTGAVPVYRVWTAGTAIAITFHIQIPKVGTEFIFIIII